MADKQQQPSNSLTIQLTVTANQGAPRLSLEIDNIITASDLLRRISETTQIALPNLKVIYRGKLIKSNSNSSVVQEFQLEQDSVLHCIGKPTTSGANSIASATNPTAAVEDYSVPSIATTTFYPNPNNPAAAEIFNGPSTLTPLERTIHQMRLGNPPGVYQEAIATVERCCPISFNTPWTKNIGPSKRPIRPCKSACYRPCLATKCCSPAGLLLRPTATTKWKHRPKRGRPSSKPKRRSIERRRRL